MKVCRDSYMENSRNYYYEPKNLKELISLVKRANDSHEKIYTVSRGYNWGLGSSSPVDDECSVINLKNLNKVHEINCEEGYVVIEPGVTQGQLSDMLQGEAYKIDVTGSSRDTSIVGNALERGITYAGLRVDNVIGLEVLLPNGELIKTGSLRYDDWLAKNHYRHGVGADLTSLFFQSNFGIVTKMTYRLVRRKKYNLSIKMDFNSQSDLLKSVSHFNALFKNNIVENVFHIANSERAMNAIAPDIVKTSGDTEDKVKKLTKRFLRNDWSGSGLIESDSRIELLYKSFVFKKTFRRYANITYLSTLKLKMAKIITSILNFSILNAFINTAEKLLWLYHGKSTDVALGSILALEDYVRAKNLSSMVEKSKRDFMYCLPITNLNEESAREIINLVDMMCAKYGFEPSVTLNPIREYVLEAVISVEFQKEDHLQAKKCIREMQLELQSKGHYCYRTNIYDMDLYFSDQDKDILNKIKSVFDPHHIISPGRYLPTEKEL